MKKKILAVVLAALMIFSILPVTVFAADAKCPGKGNVHTLDNCTSEVESVVAGTCDENDHHDGFTLYECTVCGDHFVDNFVEVEHEWVEKKKETPATCLKDGKTATYECKVCKATKGGEAIPATGHDFEIIESTGDCEHEGKIVTKCKNCDVTVTQVVSGKGHVWSEHPTSIKKEPTHTTTGIAVYTCQNEGCTETKEVIILATEKHKNVVHHKAVKASCKKAGVKEYWECTDCGKLFFDKACTKETTLKNLADPEKKHDKDLKEVKAKPATCSAAGTGAYYKCEVCGKMYSDKAGKNEITKVPTTTQKPHDMEATVIPPTCTEKGFTQLKCKVCGAIEVEKDSETPATGHTRYDDPASKDKKVTKEATCAEEGEKTWKCGNCDVMLFAPIEKLDHDYVEMEKKVATCTENGYIKSKCSKCGDEKTEVIEATGHTFALTDSKAPTCTESGYNKYKCSVCGDEKTETLAPAHDYKEIERREYCTESGYVKYKCSKCDDEKTEVIESLGGHDFVDIDTKDPTCTENGYIKRECSVCKFVTTEIVGALGHDFQLSDSKAPTCTESGYEKYKCSRCEVTDEKEVLFDPTKTYDSVEAAKKDHLGLIADVDHLDDGGHKNPTCSTEGYNKYKCPDCSSIVTITLAKVDHEYEWVEKVPATCVKDGIDAYEKCKWCGRAKYNDVEYDEKGVEITKDKNKKKLATEIKLKATGHVKPADGKVLNARAVSCEEFGYTLRQCTNEGCTYEYITDYVRATGHVWAKDTINSKAATCTEGGLTVEYCTNGCGEKKFTELEALGHKNKAGDKLEDSCTNTAKDRKCVNGCGATIGQTHHAEVDITVAATCKNYKYDLRMCNDCHAAKILKVYEAEGYGDHSYGEWTVTAQPTADAEGEETRTCQVCGDKQTRKIATTAAINASFEIVNAAKEGADFTDSALVAVKIVLNTTSTDIWGISFAVNYDSNVVKFEKYEMLSEKLDTNANAHDDKKGTVRIIAQASNGDDKEKKNVTLEGKEEFAILYFRINSAAATETEFSFGTIEAMTFEEKVLRVDGTSAKIKIKQFLDANGDGDVNMHDLLLIYKMTIGAVEANYDAVVDVNKDGVINYVDLLALYEYYLGAKDYKAMTALRP